MHLGDHVVMESAGHLLEEGVSVDVHGGGVEGVLIGPRSSIDVRRHDVHRLHRVVKVREIDVGVRVVHGLILELCDEQFMFRLDEVVALIGIQVHVGTEDLGGGGRCEGTPTALDTDLHGVVLKR